MNKKYYFLISYFCLKFIDENKQSYNFLNSVIDNNFNYVDIPDLIRNIKKDFTQITILNIQKINKNQYKSFIEYFKDKLK